MFMLFFFLVVYLSMLFNLLTCSLNFMQYSVDRKRMSETEFLQMHALGS
jgi:hypothetical protein